ncbi:RNA-dependent RNA polymerase [Hubei narna-like virus 23]|uniref:RNA-dependent RNA polymerase n=1 Tax=Hubei narna-like virus 23 TaxID=1922954 RepID=UPI0009098091|nr:RNA-dependent RNA polymerase [Hubei narna-like virus 23]APG77198.1 RNA-dependent RNA polymerase [Hubei narna-like virus 23]
MARKNVQRGSLCKLASPCLGSSTPRYLHQLDHWIKHHGEEWTCSRLKTIANAAMQLRSGHPDTAREILEEGRIAVRKDKPVPRGIMGIVALQYVNAQKPYAVRTAACLLRAYSGIYLDEVSVEQVRKARHSICDKAGKGQLLPTHPGLQWRLIHEGTKMSGLVRETPRSPVDLSYLNPSRKYFCGQFRLAPELKDKPYSSAALSLMTMGSVPKDLITLCGDFALRRQAERFQEDRMNYPGFLGKISFLQEGGCKSRTVCQPTAWLQAYSMPLAAILCRAIYLLETGKGNRRSLGLSVVHDQETGSLFMKSAMEERKEIFSYDLKSATDRFPRGPQLLLLKEMGLGDWCGAVERTAEGPYWAPEARQPWSYTVGQPMGLAYSFSLFHLTHRAILEGLAKEYSPNSPAYAVLGDDVLITCKSLALAYEDMISGLGVEISTAKSFEGPDLQSFAGFTGISSKKGITVFRPFKHGPDFQIKGKELNVLHTLGPKVREWSSWWSKQFDAYRCTITFRGNDLSPLLPEDQPKVGPNRPSLGWIGSMVNQLTSPGALRIKGMGGRGCVDYPVDYFRQEHNRLFLGRLSNWFNQKAWNHEFSILVSDKEPNSPAIFAPELLKREDGPFVRPYSALSTDPLIQGHRHDQYLRKLREESRESIRKQVEQEALIRAKEEKLAREELERQGCLERERRARIKAPVTKPTSRSTGLGR